MNKFKVGDRVRLLAEGEPWPVGEIGTVERTFPGDDGEPVYYVRYYPDEPDYPHNFGYHLDDYLELAEAGDRADERREQDLPRWDTLQKRTTKGGETAYIVKWKTPDGKHRTKGGFRTRKAAQAYATKVEVPCSVA